MKTCKKNAAPAKKTPVKRFYIQWTAVSLSEPEKLVGTLTVDVWADGWSINSPTKTYTCECHVTENSVGMRGIGESGTIPLLSETEFETIHSIMKAYYAGHTNKASVYHWSI